MKQIFGGLALLMLSAGVAFAAPSAKDVLEANHAAVGDYPADRPVSVTVVSLSGMGMTGKAKSTVDQHTGWSVNHSRLGQISARSGYDGRISWSQDQSGVVTHQESREAKRAQITDVYQATDAWWNPDFGGATITVSEKSDKGVKYAVLHVTPKGGKAFDAWFSEKDHLQYREVVKEGSVTSTTYFSDYVRHDGVMVNETQIEDSGRGKQYLLTLKLTAVRYVPEKPQSFYAAPKTEAHDFAIAAGEKETTVPIQFVGNHIVGPVSFNGGKPEMLIFDTGATNIITPEIAKAAGVTSEGKIPVGGFGSKTAEASITHVKKIRIGDAVVKDQRLIVMDLSSLAKLTGRPFNGLIGFDVFHRFVTRIDYIGGKLTLIDPKHFDPSAAGIPVPFILNGHTPQVQGKINGVPAVLDIDTGAGGELSVTADFAEKQDLLRKYKNIETVTGWGVGGPSYGSMTRLNSLSVGPVKVDNIVAGIGKKSGGVLSGKEFDGNVGSKVLKRFIVTFDYGHRIMYLKKQPLPVTDVSNYSRTGVAFRACQGQHICVLFVTKGSPAEKAGLKVGDLVRKVDGKAVVPKDLTGLDLKMRTNAAGTKMVFAISRKGEEKAIAVTLKDLI